MTLTPGRRMLLEWLILTTLLVVLAVLGSRHALRAAAPWSSLHRSDALILDTLQPIAAIAPSQTIVLVEIDQNSLDQLGRWPWPRSIHAALIDRLLNAGVQTIGLDILFIEPTADDALIGTAFQNAGQRGVRMVMPVSITRNSGERWYPLYPVPELGLVSQLAHVNFRIDGDGLVRGQYLQEGGFPSFALALLAPAQRQSIQETAQLALIESNPIARDQAFAEALWSLRHFTLLSRLNAPITRISYVDVLRASKLDELKGKTIVVGATALGLGDQYANALIGESSLSAGVELHVAAFSALEQQKLILPMAVNLASALAALLVFIAMIALYRSSARVGLLLTLLVFAVTIALAAGLLRAGFWWPPSTVLLLTAVAYPLWSWRRLEAATGGLVQQAQRLESEPMLTAVEHHANLPAEQVSRSVQQLQYAAQRSVELRRLLQSTLQNLPHPAILTDQYDREVLRNDQFEKAFGGPSDESTVQVPGNAPATTITANGNIPSWLARHAGLALSSAPDSTRTHAQEQRDKLGRDWLINTVPMRYPDGRRWTLIQLVDLSPIRAAQREREQTLRFLSHDLRTPLLSILTIMSEQKGSGITPLWQERIDTYAQRSLELADGFVQLARAENKAIEHETVDLADLIIEASDLSWAMAQARQIRLNSANLQSEALVTGDAQLIRRALTNLIDNAIKFSPPGAEVCLTLTREPALTSRLGRDCWCAAVADQGKGLPADELAQVFEPFWRSLRHEDRPGAGLGLTFVRVVAERHSGLATATANAGGGARFEFRLPTA